jgi:uncharacterized protein (TIGR03067 family)
MKRSIVVLLVAGSLAACGCGNFRDRTVLSAGKWTSERVELEGADASAETFEIEFSPVGDAITVTVGDTVHKGTYELDSGKDPKEIEIKPDATNTSDKPLKGIYAIDADGHGLVLCLSPKKRPKKFETSKGSDHVLIKLHRADMQPRPMGIGFGANGQPAVFGIDNKPIAPQQINDDFIREARERQEADIRRIREQQDADLKRMREQQDALFKRNQKAFPK